jgi:dTDP-4-amino-4,6-dideoxygalactose transaminase
MKNIFWTDPKWWYQMHQAEAAEAIERVLRSGRYILGEEVEMFEKEFAKYVGVLFCLGVASGTDALKLAIKACGIQRGEKVILPANSYPSAFGVVESGAVPVLVDCTLDTYTLDVDQVEQAIDSKTKAIVAVHLYGQAARLDKLARIAKRRKIFLIEDAAQAHGATYKQKKVGGFGDIACFSFYPTKNLGGFGDGGAVVTNNRELAEKVRLLRMFGEKTRYESVISGVNSRLDEIQAALLRVRLKYLDEENKKRRELAAVYRQYLGDLPFIHLPEEIEENKHVYHLFVIRAQKRDSLQKYLLAHGVMTGIHYPKPIHTQLSFAYLGYKKGDFPASEEASASVLSLPLYPALSESDIFYVAKLIKKFYARSV